MTALYGKDFVSNSLVYGAVLVLLCSLAFLQPRFSSVLFSFKRQQLLEKFTQSIGEDKKVEVHSWWQFREFYSPGYFEYNSAYLEPFSILQFHELDASRSALLAYKSAYLNSRESLVAPIKTTIVPASNLELDGVTGTYYLTLQRSLADMKTYNGLINYEDPDKLLNNQVWETTAEFKAR